MNKTLALLLLLPAFVFAQNKPKQKEKPAKPAVAEPAPENPAVEEDEPDAEAGSEEDGELNELESLLARLQAEEALETGRMSRELADEKAEQAKLEAEAALRKAKLERELAPLRYELERLTLQHDVLAKKQALFELEARAKVLGEITELKLATDQLKAENAKQLETITTQLNELKLKEAVAKYDKTSKDQELADIDLDVRRMEKEDRLTERAARAEYTATPFKGKTLVVSDRRIQMDGLIDSRTAARVTERIHFFNNQSTEFPIFIVIDSNPGGSVMAGYRILKAMEGSEAPVHVVVKSYAASMAAVITTLAEESYAFPNAVILHHQISYGIMGNLTQHEEYLDETREWYQRLAAPVARKMGMSLEDFTKRMYKENSDGDWNEFADEAQKLKWVNHIVEELRETSLIKNPDASKPSPTALGAEAPELRIDARGRPFQVLPRLTPFDAWFLHNPDGYYRLAE